MSTYTSLTNSAELTFDDEFNSFTSSPNGSVGWMTTYPYGGESARALPYNGQASYNSDSSVGVNPFSDSNGVLSITAAPAAAGSNPYNLPYTSGVITTYNSFAQQYGYFEVDAEMPAGDGFWPAFFLLSHDLNGVYGSYDAELDVFEVLTDSPTTLYSTVHGTTPSGWWAQGDVFNVANVTTGFHTYGVDWEPTTCTFYIDGVEVGTLPTPAAMDTPMYMLLTLAVGAPGSWPGAPDANTPFPAHFQINDVRAYATSNTVLVSGTSAIKTASITGQVALGGAGDVGVAVALLNAAGTTIATTTTNTAGNYSFTGLAAGNYQVQYSGALLQAGSEANAPTGLTPVITLAAGQALSLPTEAVLTSAASLSGQVMFAGGGVSGVAVALENTSGTVLSTTTTNSAGSFTFTGLLAGTYQVQYTPSTGEIVQSLPQGNATTGISEAITLTTGQVASLPTAQFSVAPATISGVVDFVSTGQAGVAVNLLNASGTVVASTTTASNGSYSFSGLAAGTYEVGFTAPTLEVLETGSLASTTTGLSSPVAVTAGQNLTLAAETLVPTPASLSGSVVLAGVGVAGVTVTLMNGGSTIGTTTTASNGTFSFTNLTPASYQLKYSAPTGDVLMTGSLANSATGVTPSITLTAGQSLTVAAETLLSNPASIPGKALHFGGPTDPSYGAGEGGVTVSLLNASGTVIATQVSNSTGFYSFSDIAAGTYQVQYTPPAGQAIKPGTSGLSTSFTVAAGSSTYAPSGDLVSVGTVTGQVNYGSTGQAGVTVSLLGSTGSVVATTTTGSTGSFSFTGLAAGNYQVQYSAPSGEILQTLPQGNLSTGVSETVAVTLGATSTLPTAVLAAAPASISGTVLYQGAGEAGVTASLIGASGNTVATTTTGAGGGYGFTGLTAGSYQVQFTAPAGELLGTGSLASTTTGLTSAVSVAAGQSLTLGAETLTPAFANLTGSVSFAGAGQSGVSVALLNSAGQSVASATTDSNGAFSFANLAAGTYQVQYTAPSGELLSASDAATGLSAAVTLTPGETYALPVAALIPAPATISGSVVYQGSGEAGVAASLIGATGNSVATTTTAADGSYSFTGLAAGSYQVDFTAPTAEIFSSASLANATTGLTAPVTVVAGQSLALGAETLLPAPATISGSVDFGGAGEAGVVTTLLNASGSTVATTSTASDGSYSFTGLAAGSYQVEFTAPTAEILASGGLANATTGLTSAVSVVPGQSLALGAETLLPAPATLSGSVSFAGAAQSGVSVALLNGAGQSVASATTDSNGAFSFANLAAGTYQVQYSAPSAEIFAATGAASGMSAAVTLTAGQTYALPVAAFAPAPATISGSVVYQGAGQAGVTASLIGSNDNILATTSTAADGSYSFTGLAAGSYQVDFTAPTGEIPQTGGLANPSTGLTSAVTVVAGQSLALGAETLLPNPATLSGSVMLGSAGQAGVTVALLGGNGQVLATTTTGSGGSYSFTGLSAGSYQVQVTAPTGDILPAVGEHNATVSLSPVTTLAWGQTATLSPCVLAAAASISGTDQFNGSAQSGVVTTLVDANGNNVATTTTNASGSYSFTGLAAGTYQVVTTPPTGETLTTTTQTATIVAGQNDVLATQTLQVAPATLSGSVTLSGAGESGVTVSLENVAGRVLSTTTTNSTGGFSFSGLAAGSYLVKYTAPSGAVLETGSEANISNGLSPVLTLAAGQTMNLPTEAVLTSPASIAAHTLHFGGATDPWYGSSDPNVTVSLLNSSGTVIATQTSNSNGWFQFTNIGPGTYQLLYTAPTGQAFEPGTSGLTSSFTVSSGQAASGPNASLMSAVTMNGNALTVTEGTGSYIVSGTTSNSTLTLGAGNQTVNLVGTGNTITVGTGTSTIVAGNGNDTVHAAGGSVTISANGAGNLFDAGSGMSFLNADGSAGNKFITNAGASGNLTTINGFNLGDTIDLVRTLASSNIAGNIANLGSYITSTVSGGNTDLFVDPTGGHGTPVEFAVLNNIQTSVSSLQNASVFSLS